MIYESSAIGEIALSLLKTSKTMRVHSIFNNGFNIVNDKNDLIFIGTDKNGYFPFGITINKYTMHYIRESLQVGDMLKTDASGVNHKDFMLITKNSEVYLYSKVNKNTTDAIKSVVSGYDFCDYNSSDFSEEKLNRIIADLGDPEADFPLAYLVGRGQGLTPSGDDIITGILYIDRLEPFIAQKHLDQLSSYIRESVTTIVSESFIKLALQGIFSRRITDIGDSPGKDTVDALLELGSSSGRDTLYGIYMTLNRR